MKETALRIKVFGDPCLRKKARPVKEPTPRHRDILSQMSRIMYDSAGVGLAAPQLGISERMIVADIGSGLYKLVNPRASKKRGRQVVEEGCLSVPGVCIRVKRAREVVVDALDEGGKPVTVRAQGLLACVLQHEMDHLDGRLIIDYAGIIERLKIKKRLKALEKKSEDERMPEQEEKSCKLQL